MSEANYSFTTKVNGDLFTVRGQTIEEFTMNLVGAADPSLRPLLVQIQQESNPTPAAPYTPATAPAAPAWSQPETKAAEAPTQYVCPHGARVHREGMSKKGKWEAYFCPQKGTDCKPMNTDGTFWK